MGIPIPTKNEVLYLTKALYFNTLYRTSSDGRIGIRPPGMRSPTNVELEPKGVRKGMTQTSIDICTLDAIEQAIRALPNSTVVKKLNILSSFSWLKTEELAKVMGCQTFSFPKRSETFEKKYA